MVAVRTEPEVERALQTPTRERIQGDADKATFERRALAVEQESAIAENELASQIEIARREEELVAQHGANERLRATEQAAAERDHRDGRGERERLATEPGDRRAVGRPRPTPQAALLAAYDAVDHQTLLALALKERGGEPARHHQPDTLTLTPDLLTEALARLTGGARAMTLAPRAVLVHRRSEYDELVARHGTARQVEFFLAQRGRSIAEVRERDERCPRRCARCRR